MASSLPTALQRLTATTSRLWTGREVAALFAVSPKTVLRWAVQGRITAVFTPGGHRRYPETAVRKAFQDGGGVWPG